MKAVERLPPVSVVNIVNCQRGVGVSIYSTFPPGAVDPAERYNRV